MRNQLSHKVAHIGFHICAADLKAALQAAGNLADAQALSKGMKDRKAGTIQRKSATRVRIKNKPGLTYS
jgi:hypothetical protein